VAASPARLAPLAAIMLLLPSRFSERAPFAPVAREFEREHRCPSTGLPSGPCPGYSRDHIVQLACGGPDAVSACNGRRSPRRRQSPMCYFWTFGRCAGQRYDARNFIGRKIGMRSPGRTCAALAIAISLIVMLVADANARGRTGSFRVAGYNSHGKGSHYVGGR
jgi:hypothetical protein